MTGKLLHVAQRLIKWDVDFPVNCHDGYAGLKELNLIIAEAKLAVIEVGATHVDELATPTPQTIASGYRNPNWKTDNAELEAALDAFWNVAYQQGHEQRGHDDEAGTAQKVDDELRRVIAAMSVQSDPTASALRAAIDRFDAKAAPVQKATEQQVFAGAVAIYPELFSTIPRESHRAASPYIVEIAQSKVLDIARRAIDAALAATTEGSE